MNYDINDYPAIRDYLLLFDKRRLAQTGEKNIDNIRGLNARKKTSHKWYETQDQINYSDDFYKQKIIYPCIMANGPRFMLDTYSEYFTIAPGNIIVGSNLKYLISCLNSKIYYFALRKFYMGGGIEGELKTNRLQLLPIIPPESIHENLLVEIAHIHEKIQCAIEDNREINEQYQNQIDYILKREIGLSDDEYEYIQSNIIS